MVYAVKTVPYHYRELRQCVWPGVEPKLDELHSKQPIVHERPKDLLAACRGNERKPRRISALRSAAIEQVSTFSEAALLLGSPAEMPCN